MHRPPSLLPSPKHPLSQNTCVCVRLQDQLLLTYFAHLVRTQLSLAERLGTAALPLL